MKAWQWYTGQVNTNGDDFLNFYEDEANKQVVDPHIGIDPGN